MSDGSDSDSSAVYRRKLAAWGRFMEKGWRGRLLKVYVYDEGYRFYSGFIRYFRSAAFAVIFAIRLSRTTRSWSRPVVQTIDETLAETVISSTMMPTQIVTILAIHGCPDLGQSIKGRDCSKYPVSNGGFGDVFSGKLRDGTPIAIKTIRPDYDHGELTREYHKRAAKEIHTWSKCSHPNVVQLLGAAVFRECLAMVSRWEENGNLSKYLSKNQDVDRCKLSASICAGLVYLHEKHIVHGDLKGANILIAQDGRPMIMDFGNASLLNDSLQFTKTNTGLKVTVRWTAPEVLAETTSYTAEADIYSLGMTILEVFTSQVPYPDKTEQAVLRHVLIDKGMPTRPEGIIPKRSIYGDTLWDILTKCWLHNPTERPSAAVVRNTLEPLTPDKLKEIEGGIEREED